MSESKTSIRQFSFDDFEIAVSPYADSALIVIHNGIKGCGTIMTTENIDGQIETEVLIGKDEDMLNLLAMQLAKQISMPTLVFVFAFRPEILDSFEKIQDFLKKFVENYPRTSA